MSQISRVEYSVIRRLSHRHENQKREGVRRKHLRVRRKRNIHKRLGFSCLASRNPLIVVETKCSGLSNKVTRTSSRDMCPENTTLGTHVLQLTQCTTLPLSHQAKSHPQHVLFVCVERKPSTSPIIKETHYRPSCRRLSVLLVLRLSYGILRYVTLCYVVLLIPD